MGLRPTYMDKTHLESMSFDGVGGDPTGTRGAALLRNSWGSTQHSRRGRTLSQRRGSYVVSSASCCS